MPHGDELQYPTGPTTPPPPTPPRERRASRRTVIKGAAAAVGVAGAAAFAAAETTEKHSPSASASTPTVSSVPAASTRIDLGAAKYKAKGDGSDDSAALLAWRRDIIDALERGAAGVHATVPCGVFALGRGVSLDILGDNVHLEGDGRGASVLTQLAKVNTDLVTTRNYEHGGAAVGHFSVSRLTIDANAPNQSQARWCLRVRGYDYDIESVDLLNGGAGGLSSEWTDDGKTKYMEAKVRGLGVHEYLGLPGTKQPTCGILWAGPHDSQFNEIVCSTLAAGQSDTGPAFGFVQARGASAEYISNIHVWGRNHYGIWADPKANGIRLANAVAEGSFLANVVLSGGSTWAGGEVYGTQGNQGSQPRETGISLGIIAGAPNRPQYPGITDGFGCNNTMIQAVRSWNFAAPGACVDFSATGGGNLISVLAVTGGSNHRAALYRGAPHANDDVYLVDSEANVRLIQRLS